MSEMSTDAERSIRHWWPVVLRGLRWLRGGLLPAYWRTTYGDRGWELAGKGAAAWIAGSVLTGISGADGEFHLWNPLHFASAVLVLGGLGGLISGLTREWRKARGRWSDGGLTGAPPEAIEPRRTAGDGGSAPIGERDERLEPDQLPDLPAGPPQRAAPAKANGTLLEVLQDRQRQGNAGERYVSAILRDLDRERFQVTPNLLLPASMLGRHVGDVDALIQCPETGLAAALEIKTTHPATKVDGRAVGASHRAQAARIAWAVSELDGHIEVFPFVVYVDPVGTGDRMKQMTPRTYEIEGLTVTTVGARHLKSALLKILTPQG